MRTHAHSHPRTHSHAHNKTAVGVDTTSTGPLSQLPSAQLVRQLCSPMVAFARTLGEALFPSAYGWEGMGGIEREMCTGQLWAGVEGAVELIAGLVKVCGCLCVYACVCVRARVCVCVCSCPRVLVLSYLC